MTTTTTSATAKVLATCMFPDQPPARVGRDNQRYECNGTRLVAGCVPYRTHTGTPEVMLITNHKKDKWIIPKGGWERDETETEAAAREAYEEAGVLGAVGACLVDCEYMGKSGPQRHRYFALQVSSMLDEWPEANFRTRKWVPIDQALDQCKRAGMHEAITALAHSLRKQHVAPQQHQQQQHQQHHHQQQQGDDEPRTQDDQQDVCRQASVSPTLSNATMSPLATPTLTPKRPSQTCQSQLTHQAPPPISSSSASKQLQHS
ncbi:hypothetical protein PTSG_07670 [Salpingoeca rosetta]|uniref:Nudix hydrolase domain-containing protein n=1 Tax=Salpingoeca rosetta (strain ATCC 50818 / BSB-021) TaxID=946362 RepID=F2UHF6_SALR5|nr:uncharacterized protein PTSG_07670 [Salpingoeca rosetta]EGD76555.1 hypothetical protein PTSG_07670 [Salpingoeca rosetta]|eukprot:XP_004991469.1 hypothetical protein PTSG_07670 [Salpingoeca rosetta]